MQNRDEEVQKAILLIGSTIENCENMQHKFPVGTSQHTLLVNRIRALVISKALLEDESIQISLEDLQSALPPVTSIIHKTAKAQSKYDPDSSQYRRFQPMIDAMERSKALIEKQMGSL